ncbi:MAG: DUF4468 domain-containing protein [Saprospiraceae bacterium]
MKVFFFGIILILSSIKVLSQDTLKYNFKIDDNGKVYFDEVIEIENSKATDLYIKGKEWFSMEKWLNNKTKKGIFMSDDKELKKDIKLKEGEIAIDFFDKEEGKIFAKGRTNILVYKNSFVKKNGGSFNYRLTTLFKDGKTRIVIDDLVFEGGDMMGVNSGAFINEDYPTVFGSFGKSQIKKQWVLMREQAIKEFETIISNYKEFMLKKDIKSSDW